MMFEWLLEYKQIFILMAWFSFALLLISAFVVPWLIIRLPHDYFQHQKRHSAETFTKYPIIQKLVVSIKNAIGFVLIVLGILMIALPGQGLLTILVGLVLMNFPGKYEYERKLLSMPKVLNALNWIRKKANKEPLIL